MKKNKFNLLLAGFLSLAMVGCTSETEDVFGGETGQTTTVTINLPKMKTEGTSYATTATAAENTLKNVKVIELQNGIVNGIHTATLSTASTATFTVTGAGSRIFYLAANATSAQLNAIKVGDTEANVKDVVTTASTAQITTTNGLLMDYVTPTPIAMATPSTVFTATMKRRVARFDVVNKKAETGFTLASVYIAKAKTQAYVFTPATELTAPNADLAEYAYPDVANDSVPAAFYLNPTIMGTGTNQTEITFKDTSGNLYKVAVANGKKIEENKRYVIRLSKSSDGSITGNIDVEEEWDDEDLITEEVTTTMSNLTLTTANGAKGNGSKILDMSASTGSATFTFTTSASSSTPMVITTTDDVKIDVKSTTPVLGYAGASWKQTHTVIASESLSGDHTITVSDKSGVVGTIAITAGARFVNPLKAFTKANLGSDYKIGADLTEATAGLTTSYGGWFQWGRKQAFANPSKGTPTPPVAFNATIMTEQKALNEAVFYGGANQYTWHTDAGGLKDTWTNLVSQGSGEVNSDPCPAGYRVPTVDEWLAVIPHNSNAGNYTSTHADKTVTADAERTGNQITAETGPAKYIASGAGKVLYAVKKMGKDGAYALRWSYKGTGVAFANQDSVYISGTTPAGDTYLEIVCIPVPKTFDPADAKAFSDLDWTKDAEVRFFPAAGLRRYNTGLTDLRGREGLYWSSSANSETNGWYFLLRPNDALLNTANRTNGLSVRCVAVSF